MYRHPFHPMACTFCGTFSTMGSILPCDHIFNTYTLSHLHYLHSHRIRRYPITVAPPSSCRHHILTFITASALPLAFPFPFTLYPCTYIPTTHPWRLVVDILYLTHLTLSSSSCLQWTQMFILMSPTPLIPTLSHSYTNTQMQVVILAKTYPMYTQSHKQHTAHKESKNYTISAYIV